MKKSVVWKVSYDVYEVETYLKPQQIKGMIE